VLKEHDMKNLIEKKSQRGMSLAESFIVLCILAVFLAIAAAACASCQTGVDVEKHARKAATKWASDMNKPVDGLSCGNTVNSKGMTYCTLESRGKTHNLACIGPVKSWRVLTENAQGCHEQMATIPQQPAQPQ
jgi:hypothetical protein